MVDLPHTMVDLPYTMADLANVNTVNTVKYFPLRTTEYQLSQYYLTLNDITELFS